MWFTPLSFEGQAFCVSACLSEHTHVWDNVAIIAMGFGDNFSLFNLHTSVHFDNENYSILLNMNYIFADKCAQLCLG